MIYRTLIEEASIRDSKITESLSNSPWMFIEKLAHNHSIILTAEMLCKYDMMIENLLSKHSVHIDELSILTE